MEVVVRREHLAGSTAASRGGGHGEVGHQELAPCDGFAQEHRHDERWAHDFADAHYVNRIAAPLDLQLYVARIHQMQRDGSTAVVLLLRRRPRGSPAVAGGVPRA